MIGGAKGIGLGIDLGLVNQYNRTGSQSYIEPEVLDSLVGVWSAYGMTNDSPNRSTIKNKLSNKGGDFVISNAAYDKMSSYGGYEFAKFDNTLDWYNTEGNDSVEVVSRNGHSITLKRLTGPNFWYFQNSTFRGLISNVIPFKVNSNKNISVIWDVHGLSISEGKDKSVRVQELVLNPNEDNYTNLKTLNEEELAQIDISTNSLYYLLWFDLSTLAVDEEVTIEMLPLFEGAFVTDGIDDLITSTKTVQEMLGGSNEITVVSMIHQVKDSGNNVSFTNYIRGSANGYFRNIVNNYDKTGIYGYTSSDLMGLSVVNNILGDKNDYTSNGDNRDSIINGNFSVQGYSYNDGNNTGDFSSVAWYWTIIANKVLTTDQINQVIDYFNLDRTLNPDILCNTIKQGITNENHAEFGDKLIDFSGNGRDIQLNNLAWKGGSGIAAKQYETFKDWTNTPYQTSTVTEIDEFTRVVDSTSNAYWVSMINRTSDFDKVHDSINIVLYQDDMLLVHECKYKIDENVTTKALYETLKSGVNTITLTTIDKFTDIPEDAEIMSLGEWVNPKSNKGSVKITLLPSYEGGVLLDGINDFGKVIGMPVYKDYTFIIDYERISYASSEKWVAGVVSKSHVANQGAFILMTANTTVEPGKQAYSFGGVTSFNRDDFTRALVYQSKYKCGDVDLTVGEGVDSNTLWLGTFRDNDQRFFNGAIYSLMSFPYSMSEFLIERQLKKHKLGTLYPNMVEFRPIVKSNNKWDTIEIWQGDKSLYRPAVNDDKTGIYLKKDSTIGIYVKPKDADEVTKIVVNGTEYTNLKINSNGFYYVTLPITKSPQKINITIDEYIRYEDIVQPYPSFVKLENLDRTYTYTWGDKLKVGDTIRYNSSVNLLEGAYTLKGQLECNGVYVYDNNQYITVAKEMIFAWTNSPIWSIDDNEPKCILSPRLLRIPNSSYKILGYIPDISGHGNHGKINNSAYAEGSGVNEDGSYQFDGVDDFITIPTTIGGKQVLMKVNWQSIAGTAILYDQRTNGGFAIFNRDFETNENKVPAYRARNIGGSTYIDGILNKYIYASELKNITHNIVELHDPKLNIGTLNPKIGSSFLNSSYAQMSLYDFMLFDEISTDDKIKELNKYVGIEAKVELPPYYWDTYGKTNFDADRDTIQQRGIAVGDYDLTNYNHAYNKMSGYGGYKFAKFDNTIEWFAEDSSMVVNRNGYLITLKKVPNVAFWRFRNSTLKSLDNPLTFKVKCNKPIDVIFQVKFAKNNDVSIVYNYNIKEVTLVPNESTTIIVPSVSVSDIPEATSILFINVLFDNTSLSDNEEYTVEMLPLYPNGLVYDGVEDFSDNKNVPIIDDFTVIAKRTWLEENTSDKPFIIKGDSLYPDGNQNAFLFEYGKLSTYSFGQNNKYDKSVVPSLISWATPTSYNGTTSLVKGSAIDTVGIDIAHATKMVLYKLILYPKTISLLEINFLKNLMEKDEIIDLTNPIFIK